MHPKHEILIAIAHEKTIEAKLTGDIETQWFVIKNPLEYIDDPMFELRVVQDTFTLNGVTFPITRIALDRPPKSYWIPRLEAPSNLSLIKWNDNISKIHYTNGIINATEDGASLQARALLTITREVR